MRVDELGRLRATRWSAATTAELSHRGELEGLATPVYTSQRRLRPWETYRAKPRPAVRTGPRRPHGADRLAERPRARLQPEMGDDDDPKAFFAWHPSRADLGAAARRDGRRDDVPALRVARATRRRRAGTAPPGDFAVVAAAAAPAAHWSALAGGRRRRRRRAGRRPAPRSRRSRARGRRSRASSSGCCARASPRHATGSTRGTPASRAWRLEGKRRAARAGHPGRRLRLARGRRVAPAARASQGYVLAPSPAHAATAAILRSGWSAFGGDAESAGLAVDLSSDRLRRARWLIGRRAQRPGPRPACSARASSAACTTRALDGTDRGPAQGRAARRRDSPAPPTAIVDGLLLARGRAYQRRPRTSATATPQPRSPPPTSSTTLLADAELSAAERNASRRRTGFGARRPRRDRRRSRGTERLLARRRQRARGDDDTDRRRDRRADLPARCASPTGAGPRPRSRTGCCCSSTRCETALLDGRGDERPARWRRRRSRPGSRACSATPRATRSRIHFRDPVTGARGRADADAHARRRRASRRSTWPSRSHRPARRPGSDGSATLLASWAEGERPAGLDPNVVVHARHGHRRPVARRPCRRRPRAAGTPRRRARPRRSRPRAAGRHRRRQRPRHGRTRSRVDAVRTALATADATLAATVAAGSDLRARLLALFRASRCPARCHAAATLRRTPHRRRAPRGNRRPPRRARRRVAADADSWESATTSLAIARCVTASICLSGRRFRSRRSSSRPTAPVSTRRSPARGCRRPPRRRAGSPPPDGSTPAPGGCAWRPTWPSRSAAARIRVLRRAAPRLPETRGGPRSRGPTADDRGRLCLLATGALSSFRGGTAAGLVLGAWTESIPHVSRTAGARSALRLAGRPCAAGATALHRRARRTATASSSCATCSCRPWSSRSCVSSARRRSASSASTCRPRT